MTLRDLGGVSAYALAVKNGFVGTEAEWLASLKGPTGAQGPAGKSAYTDAQESGYGGTEAAFDAALADMPGHLENMTKHVTEEEKAYWGGKADKPKTVTVILTSAGWDSAEKTQTVTVRGVLADETAQLITPIPSKASMAIYYDCGILCTGQADGALTFTARKDIPNVSLNVFVTIQEVKT